MSHIKREWVVENKWICTSCQKENLGRYMKCQFCGSPKEADEKDIVPDPASAPEVTDPELLKLAKGGEDWVCSYCNGRVRNADGNCVTCSAPKEDKPIKRADFTSDADFHAALEGDHHVSAGGYKDAVKRIQKRATPSIEVLKAKYESTVLTIVLVSAGLGGMVGGGIWLFRPHEVVAQVSKVNWTYTIDLHQKTLEHGHGWRSFGTPPSDAFDISCQNKYYGTEDCHPHDCRPHSVSYDCNCSSYECNCRDSCTSSGNGFSTCRTVCSTCSRCSTCYRTEYDTCYDQCSVYKDYCQYSYYDWPIVTTKQTTGTESEPSFPNLNANGPDQRADRTESYQVLFSSGDHRWNFIPRSLGDFRKYKKGVRWKIKVNRLGFVEPLGEVSEDSSTGR